jgi:hypothetical protein
MCSFGTRNCSHWIISIALPLTLSHVTIPWFFNKVIAILLLQIASIFLRKQNKNYIKFMLKCVMIMFPFFPFRFIPLLRDDQNSIYSRYLFYICQYKRNLLLIVTSKMPFQITHVYRRLSDEEKTM